MKIVYVRVFFKLLKISNLINYFCRKVCKQKNFLEKIKNKFFFRKKDVPLQRIFGYPFITHGEDTY